MSVAPRVVAAGCDLAHQVRLLFHTVLPAHTPVRLVLPSDADASGRTAEAAQAVLDELTGQSLLERAGDMLAMHGLLQAEVRAALHAAPAVPSAWTHEVAVLGEGGGWLRCKVERECGGGELDVLCEDGRRRAAADPGHVRLCLGEREERPGSAARHMAMIGCLRLVPWQSDYDSDYVAARRMAEQLAPHAHHLIKHDRAVAGPRELCVARLLEWRALHLWNYGSRRDEDEALRLYAEALEIRKEKLGARHPKTASTLYGMASVHDNKGNHDEALRLWEEGGRLEGSRLEGGVLESWKGDVAPGTLVLPGLLFKDKPDR